MVIEKDRAQQHLCIATSVYINYKFIREEKEVMKGGCGLPSFITRTEESHTETTVYSSCIVAPALQVLGKYATTAAPFLC